MSRDFPDNIGSYLTIGDVAAIDITGTALTIHAWIRTASFGTDFRPICAKGGNLTFQYSFGLDATGHLQFLISDTGNQASLELVTGATVVSTAGVWQSIAARKNGTGAGALEVFLAGVSDGAAASAMAMTNQSSTLRIGTNDFNSSAFSGRIAEVAIWDAALTQEEITALAANAVALNIRAHNLKGYWPLCGVNLPEPDLASRNPATQVGTVVAAQHPFLSSACNPVRPSRVPLAPGAK